MKKNKMVLKGVVLFSLVLLLLGFVSCSKDKVQNTEGYFLIDGNKYVPKTVLTIDSDAVPFDVYRYFFLHCKDEYSGGDYTAFELYPEYNGYVKDSTLNMLRELYAVKALAKDAGVTADATEVREILDGMRESYDNEEDFFADLKLSYLTEELFIDVFSIYQLYEKVYDYHYGDFGVSTLNEYDILQFAEENFVHVKHILVYYDTTEESVVTRSRVEEIRQKALNGENFDELISQYSDDSEMPEYGYYYQDEEMPDEFVAAVNELEEGQISEIVETGYGFHIIQKLGIDISDMDYIEEVTYDELFSRMVSEKIEKQNIEYCDIYDSITAKDTY